MRFFEATGFAPQIARTPVHFAQTVQNGAADAELGIGPELHMLGPVKLVQGIDQPHHAGVDQIFERHMARQPFVNAARDVTHLRQLLHQYPLALVFVLPTGVGQLARFGHDFSVRSSGLPTRWVAGWFIEKAFIAAPRSTAR